jgi:hypothetical protein
MPYAGHSCQFSPAFHLSTFANMALFMATFLYPSPCSCWLSLGSNLVLYLTTCSSPSTERSACCLLLAGMPYSLTLKTEKAHSSRMLVNSYQVTCHHIPEAVLFKIKKKKKLSLS